MINNQHAWQQLDFMAEKLEGHSSRQESRIHKHTTAKRNTVRHGSRLAKKKRGSSVSKRGYAAAEYDTYVGQLKRRLIDYHRCLIGSPVCESHLPGPFAIAKMLNTGIGNEVNN